MMRINPHVNFNGNAEEAFNFYKSVFGGEFSKIIRFKDIASDDYPVPEKELNKLMHIALPIGNSSLMANDVPESMGRVNEQENRSKIMLNVDSRKQAENVFKGLSKDGAVEVPPSENAEDPFFAMFRDKYGIEWMIEVDEAV